jgi:formate dehydrogenase alpha subunit
MDSITLHINGKEVKAKQGMTVLEAALSAGIYIPTLCYHPDLAPYGGCRLCIVEIQKMRGFPAACTTPATDGMVITTDSDTINRVRRTTLELILINRPCDCLFCDRRDTCGPLDSCPQNVPLGDRCVVCSSRLTCELQKVVDYIGITELSFAKELSKQPLDTSNPFFIIDRNRCILCSRCVRTCQELTCVGAIDMAYRGYDMKVSTFKDTDLASSICRSCGECMIRCPVGAIIPRNYSEPDKEIKTTCPYCAVGCQMLLGVKDNTIVSVRGDTEGPSNEGRLCVKGRFGISEFVHHEDRLKTPLIKRNGIFEEATWDEALDLVAQKLGQYSSDEVGVVSSARSTNEANYVMQKFGRVVLGTNNVDHCARL